jgi:HlyD family secretion protein
MHQDNQKRGRGHLMLVGITALAVVVVILVARSLKPAAPGPELLAASIVQDTVKRGEMVRGVRGAGTLVSEELIHVPAAYGGRVEKIYVLPGAQVNPDTVIVQMRNPEMEQQRQDAEWSLRTAESDLTNLQAQNESQKISNRFDLASLEAQQRAAKLKYDRDKKLFDAQIMLELDYRLSENTVADLTSRVILAREKYQASERAMDAQIQTKQSSIQQLREVLKVRQAQLDALTVRAGTRGALQQVPVQSGQQVVAGAELAVIVQPERLKGLLTIPEIQMKDVAIGQHATLDLPAGSVPAHVARIEPSAVNGIRTIELHIDAPLPAGVAPDQSADGTVEIERLRNVLYVGRPQVPLGSGSVSIFKIAADGKSAARTAVRFGRNSASTVEILEGLSAGDRIIVSDVSSFENQQSIHIK